MSMFWIILLIVAVVIVGIIVVSAMKPDDFRVTRSTRINASAEAIYPNIVDMHRWTQWSPWQQKDPAMTQTFGPLTKGIGAFMEWSGNNQVGQGRMEVIEAAPPGHVVYKLTFLKPFKAENRAEFTLQEDNGGTLLTWSMTGKSNLMSKVMDTFMNMDRMIGKDFEEGLANLKRLSED
jgi:uncharacterized protein YndB with AHSA1/START domain